MRIVISAMIDLVPGVREQTLRDAQKHIAGTEAEPGCLEYTWTPSFTRPDRIHVFEEWADEGSLKGHFESSHYAAMRDHLQKAGIPMGAHGPISPTHRPPEPGSAYSLARMKLRTTG